jgi:NADH dehydrogenase
VRLSGWLAWVLWRFIHLMNIVNFRNRVLVFLQWAWNYVTHDRSARLITGGDAKRAEQELREN